MLWIFKNLARQLTRDTGLECVLPGEVVTLQEPHFEFSITSFRLQDRDIGLTEFEEQIVNQADDEIARRSHGMSRLDIAIEIALRADGSSSDFTFQFLQASHAAQAKGRLKVGTYLELDFVPRFQGRAGATLVINTERVEWPGAGQFQGTVGNTAVQTWECILHVQNSDYANYVVENPGE